MEYLDKFVSDRQRLKGKKPLARRTSIQTQLFALAGGPWRPHDLRRTAASRMGELGITPLGQWGATLERFEAGELPGAEVIDLSARRAKK